MDKEKKQYWRKRIYERANSNLRSMDIPFKEIIEWATFIGADTGAIQKQIDTIYNDFGELLSMIKKIDVEGGENEKNKENSKVN